jgi:hypothetical protein
VTSTNAEWSAGRTTIVTRVTFSNLSILKGSLDSHRVQLVLSGGRIGDEEIVTEGQPQFAEGGRYVVLCRSDDLGSERNRYIPIIGLNQGYFPIRQGHRSTGEIVFDAAGREVVGIENGRLMVASGEVASAPSKGTAVDLPFTAPRMEATRSDSLLEARARVRTPRAPRPEKAATAIPPPTNSRGAASVSPPDWVPGSQRAVMSDVPATRVLSPSEDPGSRMSETRFLNELRRLIR